MVIALKQIVPCELQREEDSIDDQFSSVVDIHPVLHRNLRQLREGNASREMPSSPNSDSKGFVNNFNDSFDFIVIMCIY